jgi:hypothetical protein
MPLEDYADMAPQTNEESSVNIFKTFTLKWWQGALFKLGMWASGIAVGAYSHTIVSNVLQNSSP